jgi:hypothetical protein
MIKLALTEKTPALPKKDQKEMYGILNDKQYEMQRYHRTHCR